MDKDLLIDRGFRNYPNPGKLGRSKGANGDFPAKVSSVFNLKSFLAVKITFNLSAATFYREFVKFVGSIVKVFPNSNAPLLKPSQ